MTDPTHTDRIIAQGRALVRAIAAMATIEPSGPFECALAGGSERLTATQAQDG